MGAEGFVNPSQVHGVFDGRHVDMTTASPRGMAWPQRNGTCVAVELKLRESILGVNVSVAKTMSAAGCVFSDREIRDPVHAEQFFTTAVQLAGAMDGVKYP